MYILSPFFILEFCLCKTLEVWNHGHPCPFMNVHPCTFFIRRPWRIKYLQKKGVRIPNSPLNYHLKCAKALFASAIL